MQNLQGQLLLAAPSMLDPNFERAVVLVVEHGESGAIGLILNRPTHLAVRDVVPAEVEVAQSVGQVLRKGGPCEGPLMVLHGDKASSQIEVVPGVHFATEQDLVEAVMRAAGGAGGSDGEPEAESSDHGQHDGDPGQVLYFAGYAGWGPQQLEAEIAGEAWLVVPAAADEVFAADGRSWSRLVRTLAREAVRHSLNPKIVPPDPSVN